MTRTPETKTIDEREKEQSESKTIQDEGVDMEVLLGILQTSEECRSLLNTMKNLEAMTDSRRMVVFHYATHSDMIDVVRKLLEYFPEGAKARNLRDRLPVHVACASGSSEVLVKLLIDSYPEGLQVKDTYGFLPLHYAASRGRTKLEILELLLERYSEGIYLEDDNGRLPVHHACEIHSLDYIRLLVEADRNTLIPKSCGENTPLQLAYYSNRSVEIKTYLARQEAAALQEIRDVFLSQIEDLLGLPDLVVEVVWEYAKPNVWCPP